MADSKLIQRLPIKGATTASGSQFQGYLPVLNADGQIALTFIPASHTGHVSDTSLHLTSSQNSLLDSLTATAIELNRVTGVTSSIQAQIDAKAASATTLAGYGITDAQPHSAALDAFATITPGEFALEFVAASDANTMRALLELSPSAIGDASGLIAGTIDVARIPVLPSQVVQVSSGALADLTSPQQAAISTGTVVTTTDGNRWVYKGTGSKTDAANYIILADISPAWGTITGTLTSQSDLNTALSGKAPLASPTFTGTVTLPSTTSIGNVSATELGYLDGVTSSVQTQLNALTLKIATANLNPLEAGTPTAAQAIFDLNAWKSSGGQIEGDVINISIEGSNLVTWTLTGGPSNPNDLQILDDGTAWASTISTWLNANQSTCLSSSADSGVLTITRTSTGSTGRVLIESTRNGMGQTDNDVYGSDGSPSGATSVEVVPAPGSGFKNHILSVSIAGGSGWSGAVALMQSSHTILEFTPDGLAGVVPFTRTSNSASGPDAIANTATTLHNTGNSTTGSPGLTCRVLYVTLPA